MLDGSKIIRSSGRADVVRSGGESSGWDEANVFVNALEYGWQQATELLEKIELKASSSLSLGAVDTSWDGQSTFVLNDANRRSLPRGLVVDIGAHDGVWQSNSNLFVQLGYPGLLVEAMPETYASLAANVGTNPNVTARQLAIGLRDGELVQLVRSGWRDGTENHVDGCVVTTPSCVKSKTLQTVLAEARAPPRSFLLSLDIEWKEDRYLELFQGLSRSNRSFDYVIVENCNDPPRMAAFGYEYLRQFRYDAVYRHV